MPQSKSQIQDWLSRAGTHPIHRLGQNFMIDANLVRCVADAAEANAGDWVLEIGPGTGTLTDELLDRGCRVLAVEIDRKLAGLLRERLADQPRFEILETDALASKQALAPQVLERIATARQQGCKVKLAANLPYAAASPLIVELLLAGVGELAFTVQKEVADRLVGGAGDEAYGPLGIIVQRLATAKILRILPPQAFWPQPKIDSALVRLTARLPDPPDDAREFARFIHQLFSFRRKTLRKCLTLMQLPAGPIAQSMGLDERVRPEALPLETLEGLFHAAKGYNRPT